MENGNTRTSSGCQAVPYRVLVVDDTAIYRLLVREALPKAEYQITEASSGEQALELLKKDEFDVVLLDINMPGIDGLETCTLIHADPAMKLLPVIMLTADGQPEDIARGFDAGAADYIPKPFKQPELIARVKATTEHKRMLDKLKAAQHQLLQSEKLASIGQLAAGVAHEINNPIGFVTSNLGSLENYLKDIFAIITAYESAESGPCADGAQLEAIRALKREKDFDFLKTDIVQLMAESKEGLARVAKIVSDLKDFSRPSESTPGWADLHLGLDVTLNIVSNVLNYKCTVIKNYGQLPQVWCVLSQLNQVFMHLLVNAAHAIPDKGEITIRSGHQGEQVFVSIADNGVGIPPENFKRIFDPFFTTKPVGKGSGLGLSLVYGIVQNHRGRIEVDSTPGKGTTFTVWLPINPADIEG